MAEEPLYMLRLYVDARRLMELGVRRGLPLRDVDLGYLLHCQLRETFGDLAPQPFAIAGRDGRHLVVLAYSGRPPEELRRHADAFADPELHAAVDWPRFHSKALPGQWREGSRIGFRVRVCPVVRMARDGPKHKKGAEVDAFLARCFAADDALYVDREAVYREWLSQELGRDGACRVVRAELAGFRRGRAVRRTQGEKRRTSRLERPDATIAGEVEVTSGPAFAALLRRGLGRHRAFGFGMLLLRPAGG